MNLRGQIQDCSRLVHIVTAKSILRDANIHR